jgi:hypothetical protein
MAPFKSGSKCENPRVPEEGSTGTNENLTFSGHAETEPSGKGGSVTKLSQKSGRKAKVESDYKGKSTTRRTSYDAIKNLIPAEGKWVLQWLPSEPRTPGSRTAKKAS